MARRIKTYILLRQIHFYSSAFLMVFLLLFFVTGYLLTQHDWFDHPEINPVKTGYLLDIPLTENETDRKTWIREAFSLVGKAGPVRQREDGSWHVDFTGPRQTIRTHVFPQSDSVYVERSENPTFRTLVVLHRMHDYGGGRIYDIYLAFMDLVSISLFVFCITGIYLWLKLIPSKWLGVGILLAGLGYVSWVVLTFLYW